VLAALHLTDPDLSGLRTLSDAEWHDALQFAHRSTVGLDLRRAARDAMPAWVREELDACLDRNRERIGRLRKLYAQIDASLDERGIPWIALKGMTHACLFGAPADERQQCDIDIYVPPDRAAAARDVFLEWGYEPMEGMEAFPTDHLPAMIRKTGWEWRGDYFDIEAPFAIEIHIQFWNEKLERLPAPGVEQFWHRRERRSGLPALAAPDALGYAALHFLKHVFQGSARPFHALEIARFLDARAEDDRFWSEWASLHSPELRRLQEAAFGFAQAWFGGRRTITRSDWFDQFASSPLINHFHPNKDELWLHLSLIESPLDRLRVARRRLLPMRFPSHVSGICIPAEEMTPGRRIAQQARRALFAAGRLRRHTVALPRVVASGARWWLGKPFWSFLAAAALFNFALFVFVLLYNLFLLGLGFREDFIGTLSSVSTLGTMAGTLPAAFVMRRFGLRRTLLGAIGGGGAVVCLRAMARAPAALIGLSAAWGLIFSLWAVIIAPSIAAAVRKERRPAAFSVFFAGMFSIGIAGNWVGGRLPGLMHDTKAALLLAGLLVWLALIPAWRFRVHADMPSEPVPMWPRGGFLKRYLAAYAVWQLATGAFNPFANVFFARLGFSAARIGSLFSFTQIAQVGTVLLAPAIIRRAGLSRAIVGMMAATALGLYGMSVGAAPVLAYAWYMGLQWMSEPGMNTLLMNNVPEDERSGASSLNYLVAFAAQAVAAFAAGHLFGVVGYGPVLAAAGVLAVVAAAMFGWLM
jgi:MFS family permease